MHILLKSMYYDNNPSSIGLFGDAAKTEYIMIMDVSPLNLFAGHLNLPIYDLVLLPLNMQHAH